MDPIDEDFEGDEYGWGEGYWENPTYHNPAAVTAVILGYSS